MNPQSGITVRCVYCKTEKTLTWEEASMIKDIPFCDKNMCGGPMVPISGTLKQKAPKKS